MHRRKKGGRSSVAGESAEGPFQRQVSIEVGENLGDTMEGKQRDSARVPKSGQRRRNNETEIRAKQEIFLKKKKVGLKEEK